MTAAILAEVRDEIAADWQALVARDRRRLCTYLRRAAQRDWKSSEEFVTAGERSMRRYAIDWDRLLKILQILATILAPLFTKGLMDGVHRRPHRRA